MTPSPPVPVKVRPVAPRLMIGAVLAMTTALGACGGQEPSEAPTSGEAVKQRAVDAQTARRRTGAEIQDHALNRVVRAVYICNNGERLTVDFDNPRQMATVRLSGGEAVDLIQQRAADGIWYRAAGYDLRGVGVSATWAADGAEPTVCRAVD